MYRDAAGVKRTAGWADGKKAALALAQAEELKIRAGAWRNPDLGKILFSEYFEEHWLPNRVIGANTVAAYSSHYRSSLKREFGDIEVRRITTAQVQRWVISLNKAGVNAATIRAKFKVLSACLGGTHGASAVRDGLILTNPCLGVELPFYQRPPKHVYSVSEVDSLMAAIDSWWRVIPMFAADTGLRWGELMGLSVSDIATDVVHVGHTIIEVNKGESGNGTRFMTQPWPKNKRRRKVRMSGEMAEFVAQMIRDRRLFPADRLFSMPGKEGSVRRSEPWPTGQPISRSFFRQSIWLPAHLETGVPRTVDGSRRTFHHLRGSHISWLLAGGADVSAVMERAGHARISTTQLYVDALRDADTRTLAALENYRTRSRGL